MRQINKIIVHCSATGINTTTEQITNVHRNLNHWSDNGYHFVIEHDGTICHARPVETIGAHCLGQNQDSIGVCLVGGKNRFDFSYSQLANLRSLIKQLCRKYNISPSNLFSHYEFSPKKECPRFDVKNFMRYENF